MWHYIYMSKILGLVYDLDDTLLNNYPAEYAPHNLHEVSRVKATRTVGECA